MLTSVCPRVHTNINELRTDLLQNGWGVYQLLSSTKNEEYLQQIHHELDSISFELSGELDEGPFYPRIPRVLSGMIKHAHVSMIRTAHELRKEARPIFFELMNNQSMIPFLEHPIPIIPEELSCNPDAIYVSSGKLPVFPQSVNNQINQNDLLWWHIDADKPVSFLQSSVVLQNPEGSEEFCVYERSHMFTNVLNKGSPIPDDFYLLTDSDKTSLEENGCRPISMRIPQGCIVFWFSSTVHTVKPFHNAVNPRIQVYTCYATTKHLDSIYQEDLIHMKTLAILLGGSCRHLPYPCSITWQNGNTSLYRDLISFEELYAHCGETFFGTSKETDFIDSELSLYGLTRENVRNSIEYWKTNWTSRMSLFEF
jgi:hypothetical protein